MKTIPTCELYCIRPYSNDISIVSAKIVGMYSVQHDLWSSNLTVCQTLYPHWIIQITRTDFKHIVKTLSIQSTAITITNY